MRQEVQATIRVTFDADADMSREKLLEAVNAELCLMLGIGSKVILLDAQIESLKEEAAIYGNA